MHNNMNRFFCLTAWTKIEFKGIYLLSSLFYKIYVKNKFERRLALYQRYYSIYCMLIIMWKLSTKSILTFSITCVFLRATATLPTSATATENTLMDTPKNWRAKDNGGGGREGCQGTSRGGGNQGSSGRGGGQAANRRRFKSLSNKSGLDA